MLFDRWELALDDTLEHDLEAGRRLDVAEVVPPASRCDRSRLQRSLTPSAQRKG